MFFLPLASERQVAAWGFGMLPDASVCRPPRFCTMQGAERQVRVPAELERFAKLPMRVEYCLEEDKVGAASSAWAHPLGCVCVWWVGGWGGGGRGGGEWVD